MIDYKCSCSERPLGIIEAKVVMENGTPYQQLEFACTNKACKQYQRPVFRQRINLLSNSLYSSEKME